jgi:hypothetical protein
LSAGDPRPGCPTAVYRWIRAQPKRHDPGPVGGHAPASREIDSTMGSVKRLGAATAATNVAFGRTRDLAAATSRNLATFSTWTKRATLGIAAIGSVEGWIEDRLSAADSERVHRQQILDRERDQLVQFERTRERHFAQYRAMVEADDPLARYALRWLCPLLS